MKIFFVLAFVCMAAGSAFGQLGKAEDTTSATFGKPVGSPHNSGNIKVVNYRTSTYEITAGFKDGKTVYLIYKKSSGADWSVADVMSVLNANNPAGNGFWQKTGGNTKEQFHPYSGATTQMNGVQSYQLYSNKSIMGEYHPEAKAVVVWDSAAGVDGASLVGLSPL
ncbi:MAG TPA: hypothetical protein VG733_02010 [Chthoniobacteraceae bacterium]|nr:hypothetical protein [Chthoniobacteraceae bacterium]